MRGDPGAAHRRMLLGWLELNTSLRIGGYAGYSANRVAGSIRGGCTARDARAKEFSALVSGAVARATHWYAFPVEFDATARSRTDDFSLVVRHTPGVWLWANDSTVARGRAALISGFDSQRCQAKSERKRSGKESCDFQLQSSKYKQPPTVLGRSPRSA